jgi:glycosyltransferase involved in cell wall biosynthesis
MGSRKVVDKCNSGIIVEYTYVDQIKAAIVCLRDSMELHRTLGNNDRKALLQKYNWTMIEQKLYKIYEGILGRSERYKSTWF